MGISVNLVGRIVLGLLAIWVISVAGTVGRAPDVARLRAEMDAATAVSLQVVTPSRDRQVPTGRQPARGLDRLQTAAPGVGAADQAPAPTRRDYGRDLLPAPKARTDTRDPTQLLVDLPPVTVALDDTGALQIGSLSVAQLGHWMGQDLSALAADAGTVAWLAQSNVQHLAAHSGATGLELRINGQRIPSLAWDRESLVATAELLRDAGLVPELYVKAAPLLQALDLELIVHLPRAAAAAPIPLAGAAPAAHTAPPRGLMDVAQLSLPIYYAADGSLSVFGMPDSTLSAITGMPWTEARLTPDLVGGLMEARIARLTLATAADGVQIAVNGRELPLLTWAEGEVDHLLAVAAQIDLWQRFGSGSGVGQAAALLQRLLPLLQASDIHITAHFPTAPDS